jgi:hypothetical protein
MRQGDGRFRGDADVLGDALVRVVVLAAGEAQAIVPGLVQPTGRQLFGEPGPPVHLQPALDHEVRAGHDDGEGRR